MLTQEQKDQWLEIMMKADFGGGAGWQNRIHSDVPSFMNSTVAYKAEHLVGLDAVFMGIPWEGMVGVLPGVYASTGKKGVYEEQADLRAGTYDAPDYIRHCSRLYDGLIDPATSFFPEVSDDFNMGELLQIADYGNVEIKEWDAVETMDRAYKMASDIVKGGGIPLVIGGDHTIPYSTFKAISDNTEGDMGLIWYDRHYDNVYGGELPYPHTTMDRPNSGNALYKILDECKLDPSNVAMIGPGGGDTNFREMTEVMKMLGIKVFTITDVEEQGMKAITEQAIEIAGKNTARTYVTLDSDAMDPFSFPAMRWIEPFGISARDIKDSLAMVAANLNLAGFDLACVGPAYDTHQLGGTVAARFYIEILKQLAIKKQANKGAEK